MFKDGGWKSDKQQAAEQHKQQSGDDADLRLTDVPVLRERENTQYIELQLCTFINLVPSDVSLAVRGLGAQMI